MADLIGIQASDSVKLAGCNSAGIETNFLAVDVLQNAFVKDAINSSCSHGVLAVATSAVEAKVGGARLPNRRLLVVTPTNGIIYYGSSNTVTTATGTPIFKNQSTTFIFTDNVPLWLIAAATVDVRIIEGA